MRAARCRGLSQQPAAASASRPCLPAFRFSGCRTRHARGRDTATWRSRRCRRSGRSPVVDQQRRRRAGAGHRAEVNSTALTVSGRWDVDGVSVEPCDSTRSSRPIVSASRSEPPSRTHRNIARWARRFFDQQQIDGQQLGVQRRRRTRARTNPAFRRRSASICDRPRRYAASVWACSLRCARMRGRPPRSGMARRISSQFLQRGRDVVAERGRHIGSGATIRPSPATGAIASSTSAISSSLAPAASARPVLHSRQTAGDPMATDTPTCSSAAVLGSRADCRPGQARARPRLRRSLRRSSPACATSPGISPCLLESHPSGPYASARRQAPFHLGAGRVPSP